MAPFAYRAKVGSIRQKGEAESMLRRCFRPSQSW
jgi:hypothetical protein